MCRSDDFDFPPYEEIPMRPDEPTRPSAIRAHLFEPCPHPGQHGYDLPPELGIFGRICEVCRNGERDRSHVVDDPDPKGIHGDRWMARLAASHNRRVEG